MLEELIHVLAQENGFDALCRAVGPNRNDGLVTGLAGSARHLAFAALLQERAKVAQSGALCIVTFNSSQAEVIAEDVKEFLPGVDVLLFPEEEAPTIDITAQSPDMTAMRLSVLEHLLSNRPVVVVTTISAITQPVMSRSHFQDHLLTLTVGESFDLTVIATRLMEAGYERVDLVERRGQYSLRGGILDIYPLLGKNPYRIEWFDTDVDSIRTFDVNTQRSIDKLTTVKILPACDVLVPKAAMAAAAETLEAHLSARIKTVTDLHVRDRMQIVIGEDIRKLQLGQPFPGIVRYRQLLTQHFSTLLDYCLTRSLVVCIDEPSRLAERERALEKEFTEWLSAALLRGEILSGTVDSPYNHRLFEDNRFGRVQFATFARPTGASRFGQIMNFTAKSMQSFHGQMNVLKAEVSRWQKAGSHIVFVAATEERADRLARVLEDYRIPCERAAEYALTKVPQILVGNLSTGFELPLQHLVVVVESEVFGAKKKTRRARMDMSDAERIRSYQELNPGDYVVHINHGIGKYHGVQTLEIDGRHKDYLHLTYAGNDSLYVPVDQIDQVQRYVGSEDKVPKLYHLGGGEWSRVKSKVSKTVRDIAADLVTLYAKREASSGYPFAVDTSWQKEFEAMFPYEETPDQLRAIADIKRDMEKARPMDRLLCGDVGYGKTEVAIRAAFKAAMDGKQVAVLVPTTILAQQHYETFKERFAGFPLTIEVLSRFRTRAESEACITGLRDGSVDVVIGTHRLLQKSIQFKDLGLLIVDEEQRFGVAHKERLKQLRANVDCLTLTATPIPRTLHMSMMGVRDLSVIETPPENRFPVQTYVVEFHESLIRESIERELSRGGQVYVLHNQVQSILSMADRILRLVPEARVAVAHGQMAEDELERVMLEFLEGDIDVLVTTTIIETGLDIPNVNTLVVCDADRLGLSQLYQLRGRVGRSNRIAYSYFTYQRDKVLTEVAEKRLQAIKEFTELGSGFKIAMRDLSIRGAGNLLGAEQHGFINSVGFDMYSEMLSQAVREIRGEETEEEREASIELPIEAYLPEDYIADVAQKISMYKKFKFIRSMAAADDLEEELEDRFGDLPSSARNLLDVTRLKCMAVKCGADAVTQAGGETSIRFPADTHVTMDYAKLFSVTLKHQGQPTKRHNGITFVSFKTKGLDDRALFARLLGFLTDYDGSLQQKQEVEQFAK